MANKAVLNLTLTFLLISASLLLCVPQAFASTNDGPWVKTYGGAGNDYAFSVIQTSDGGYAMAGHTNSSGAGGYDFWLVKTNSTGNQLWNKTYGGAGNDYAFSVIQTSDGGYAIAGRTFSFGAGYSDFWLVKTNSAGNQLWSKTYGGPNYDGACFVVQTSDGGYALAGWTSSFGAGNYDFWLVRTDSSGNQLWVKTYGGAGDDEAFSVVQSSDGGYALLGRTNSSGAGGYDFWLVKTNSAGDQLWNKTFGGTGDDEPWSMVHTTEDGYALAGYTTSYGAGSTDFWLVKTDSSGNKLWNKTYGGTGYDEAYSVVQSSDGGYALAGYTTSYGVGSYDFRLVKTDSAGSQLWSHNYGGAGDDEACIVVQSSDGGYALAGYTASFGAGNYDFWLVKTDSVGSVQVAVPTFSSSGGTYYSPQNVVIQCDTAGAIIRYTIDGSEPTATSNVYMGPILVNSTMTIKAKAFVDGMSVSATATATYTVKVATPAISPVGGSYSVAQNVVIQCDTAGAIIRYTIDGSEPTNTSTVYTDPIPINSNTTIKAKAFKNGMTDSDMASVAYAIISTPDNSWLIITIVGVVAAITIAIVGVWLYFRARKKSVPPPPLPPPSFPPPLLSSPSASTVSVPTQHFYCRFCGQENIAEATFCQACGKPMK